MGLAKIRSKRVGNFVLPFSPFFFLGTGVHPHPPPTTYWCQTNLKYDFWGLGTIWPHQPPKIAGWLAPWATAKGRTPWHGASPLAQGGPPPVALSTSYRGVNVICLCLGAYRKPIFLVLHLKIKLFPMFSITIDLVGKYRTQATARRRSRERTLSWTNWLVQQYGFTCLNNKKIDITINSH